MYTAEYDRATAYVSGLMTDAGLEPRVDAAGNLIGRWAGTDADAARVLTGSHYDTTLNAGAYDGVLGVLGAIEAVRELRAAGHVPRRTLEVIGFAGEEPRFGAGCIGSRLMMGTLARADLDSMRDREGVSVADAMRSVDLDPDAAADARLDATGVHCFVELHIEQGEVLEAKGLPIGVVERIAAPHDLRVVLTGKATHSGATPMALRRDAFAGAAEAAVQLERLALDSSSGTTVATIGVVRVEPGAVNIVPGTVTLDVDIRDGDLAARTAVVEAFEAALAEIAGRRELGLDVTITTRDTPAACAPLVVDAVRGAVEALGYEYLVMTSGAYHDAMVLGSEIPMGMIFVPSRDGLSHHPDEYTAPEELDRGVAVLARTLATLTA